jgi:hypothetical protein
MGWWPNLSVQDDPLPHIDLAATGRGPFFLIQRVIEW